MQRFVTALVVGVVLSLTTVAVSAQGSWSTDGPLLPTPRSEIGATIVDGQIYVLGGGLGESQKLNEVLDVVTGQWRTGAPMPIGLNHHGVTALNGRVYVFGGSDVSGRPSSAALEYDPSTNSWRTLPDLPTARSSPGVAVLNGLLYVVGGIVARDTPVVEIYDPTARHVDDGTVARIRAGSFRPGRAWRASLRDWRADRHAGAQRRYGRDFGTGGVGLDLRDGVAATEERDSRSIVGGMIYIFGGEDPGQTHGEVFAYDPSSDSWSESEPPMPTPRHGLAAVEYGGRIHVIGGGTSPGGGADSSFHEILTP